MVYLHDKDIVHRDLKPENVLIHKDHKYVGSFKPTVKIIDFGFAAELSDGESLNKAYGSPYYAAPEVYNNKGYDQSCDIWSIGVILYILLTGEPPFNGNTDAQIRR